MKRIFAPSEFSFGDNDFKTPDTLIECLRRMEPNWINAPGYATKMYQAVTNQNSFDNDAWFDISFEVGARQKLQEFVAALDEWHQTNGVENQFLPDILANSFHNTPWVQEDLTAVGMVPGQRNVKPSDVQHSIELSHRSLSM